MTIFGTRKCTAFSLRVPVRAGSRICPGLPIEDQRQREQASDLNYLMLADPYYTYNDPLRYEKAMLRRWFKERFGGGTYGSGTADSR